MEIIPRTMTLILHLAALAAILQASCSSGAFKLSDRREGIEKGVLRIYVRDETAEHDGSDAIKGKNIWETLSAKGKDRAVHLVLSYIRTLTTDPRKYSIFDDMIMKSLDRGVMVFRECADESCEAFIDYQVKDLIDAIDRTLKGADGGK